MIRILKYGEMPLEEILFRGETSASREVEDTVAAILADVKENGDAAVKSYCLKFDGFAPEQLRVSEEEIEQAYASADSGFIKTLELARENIEAFHKRQLRTNFVINDRDGVVLGQKITPIENVGIYVPGGTASYPSSVLMDSVPAVLAGCKRIVMVSPPGRDGKISAPILAAARVAGVTDIYKVGGAQAIGALAYGTQSVPRVDKIVGPGNIFVATAKRRVYGTVDIDMIAGPSEILVISDDKSDPVCVAADLLSQAEHDKMSSAVLICTSEAFAGAVSAQIELQIPELPRAAIARASIDNNGKIIIVPDIASGIAVSNEIAPEHLELCVDSPFDYLNDVKNAGSIFLGRNAPEALGDYLAGPNHTLPTLGTARFSSPLSVDDFIKKSSFIYYTREALGEVKDAVADFAEREGLSAHARSVTKRFEK